ncbi:MAG: hypothetical protein ACPGEF_05155, partial [Endozoicomonas sp.]
GITGILGTGIWLGKRVVNSIPESTLSLAIQNKTGFSASTVDNALIFGATLAIASGTILGGLYLSQALSTDIIPYE